MTERELNRILDYLDAFYAETGIIITLMKNGHFIGAHRLVERLRKDIYKAVKRIQKDQQRKEAKGLRPSRPQGSR